MTRRPHSIVALLGSIALMATGSVMASQSAKHEAEELRRLKLSLIEAIVAAEKQDGGRATSAEFEFKPGHLHTGLILCDGVGDLC